MKKAFSLILFNSFPNSQSLYFIPEPSPLSLVYTYGIASIFIR